MSVETQEKLSVILLNVIADSILSTISQYDIQYRSVSKYAERRANTQIYLVKRKDVFVLLTFVSVCERANNRKLI